MSEASPSIDFRRPTEPSRGFDAGKYYADQLARQKRIAAKEELERMHKVRRALTRVLAVGIIGNIVAPHIPGFLKNSSETVVKALDQTAVVKLGDDVLKKFPVPEKLDSTKKIDVVQPGDLDPFPNRPPDELRKFCSDQVDYEFSDGRKEKVSRVVNGLVQLYYDGQYSLKDFPEGAGEQEVFTKLKDSAASLLDKDLGKSLVDPNLASHKISNLKSSLREDTLVSDGEAMMEILSYFQGQGNLSDGFSQFETYWSMAGKTALKEETYYPNDNLNDKSLEHKQIFSDRVLDLAVARRLVRGRKDPPKNLTGVGKTVPILGAVWSALRGKRPATYGDHSNNSYGQENAGEKVSLTRRQFLKWTPAVLLGGAVFGAVGTNYLEDSDLFSAFELNSVDKVLVKDIVAQRLPKLFSPSQAIQGVARFVDKNGASIAEIINKDSDPIKYDEVPKAFWDFLVATEDAGFWEHNGVSTKAVTRAMLTKDSGGSTLTQQVVKMLCWSDEENKNPFNRQVKKTAEIFLASAFERLLEKQLGSKEAAKKKILELYANLAPMGTGIFGIARAADYYFDKKPLDLGLPQCAFLAGMPQGPALDPYSEPSAYKDRYADDRLKEGAITADQYDWIKTQDKKIQALKSRQAVVLNLYSHTHENFNPDDILHQDLQFNVEGKKRQLHNASSNSQQFATYVSQLMKDFAPDGLGKGRLEIKTTLDPQIQARLEGIIADSNDEILKNGGEDLTVFVRDEKGRVLATVGNISASRPSGSVLKPVEYAQALSRGVINDGDNIPDGSAIGANSMEIMVKRPGDRLSDAKKWVVSNFQTLGHGSTFFKKALAQSFNMAAVGLAMRLGSIEYARGLERIGAVSQISDNFLKNWHWVDVLGPGSENHGVSAARVAQMGAVFSDDGQRVDVAPIESIELEGQRVYEHNFEANRKIQVFSPKVVKDICDALGNDAYRPLDDQNPDAVRKTWSPFSHSDTSLKFWGKTGTAQSSPGDKLHCWTLGGVEDGQNKYTVSVFMRASENSSGLIAVAPVWRKIINMLGYQHQQVSGPN